uniref:Uncharacterized protein n=1 Tax=Neogobius melanostomus TaxID=47308 RepID=A0A8C6WXP1_9GOBI
RKWHENAEKQNNSNEQETAREPCEDVIDDLILQRAMVIFREYVIECLTVHEQDDQNVKQAVEVLVHISSEIRQNAVLQRLVDQVEGNFAEDIFMTVARSFSDGIHFGRITALIFTQLSCDHILKNLVAWSNFVSGSVGVGCGDKQSDKKTNFAFVSLCFYHHFYVIIGVC